MRAFFLLVLSGCTLVVGSDPRVDDPEAGGLDATPDEAEIDAQPKPDAQPPPPPPPTVDAAAACDAGGCNATKDACKKTCDDAAKTCNDSCGGGPTGASCHDACTQQQTQCHNDCLATCLQCVSGCGTCGP